MVTLMDDKNLKDIHARKFVRSGDKILKKYRKAAIKKAEYRKLKAIVPSVANQKTVSKLTVIEEAIKYIDQLHSALVRKVLTSDPNNSNNNNNNDDDNNTEAKAVLQNLQRSCESKALPFSCADDFIRNFILQQQQQQQIHSQALPQHPFLLKQLGTSCNNVAAKNRSINPFVDKDNNDMFPHNIVRVAQQVMPRSQQHLQQQQLQQNATLTTETVLSSTTSAMLPKVSTVSRRPLANVAVPKSDFVVNRVVNKSNNHTNAFLAKRILF